MRISTSMVYQNGLSRLGELQSGLARTQQQLATNRRILAPSDDPIASARVLDVSQSKAINERMVINRQDVRASLNAEEGTLDSVTNLLQDAKTAIIQAGNPTLDDNQRKFIATDLRNRLDGLVALANSRDGAGNYIFGGFQTEAQPFVQTAGGIQYAGDQGNRTLQVSQARQLALSDTGDSVFTNIPALNSFRTMAGSTNTGSGTINQTSVADSTLLTGHNYSIDISGGGTAVSVYDLTLDPGKSTPLPASGAYGSGQAINFDGLSVTLSGSVSDGDTFNVQPAPTQDIFSTLNNAINLLNTPVTSASARTTLDYGLKAANGNLEHTLDRVLTVRASVGSRLNELDSLDTLGEDLDVQYQSTLSSLQDVDIAKAISELTQQKATLEAAQQSFVKVSGLSLFNYIT